MKSVGVVITLFLLSLIIASLIIFPSVSIEKVPKLSTEPALRIVAIGDVHGDLEAATRVLSIAGIIDKNENWIAKDTVLVQTGDIVDRERDTIALYALMQKLTTQAEKAGGRVVALLGNHEIMNMMQDLRYVTKEDFDSFGGPKKRLKAWEANGFIGKYLRSLDIVANVNGTIFVHGGISEHWAKVGIEKINAKARAGLTLSVEEMYKLKVLVDGDNPVWYRGYAQDPEKQACATLNRTLTTLKAERMVIGHTPQFDGRILARCKVGDHNRLFVVDVAMSKAYGSAGSAALEILHYSDGSVKVHGIYPTHKDRY